MTADPYATAAGLVARSAAAYAASIPEDPADEGFFGPGSVTWRVSTDLSSPVAGLRALLMQALHPLAMAGVDQHSDWRRDPGEQAGRHVRLPGHDQLCRARRGRAGRGPGAPHPSAGHRGGQRDRPPLRRQ